MAQVRNILADVKKIDTIETTVSTVSSNVSQLQTEVTDFDALPSQANQAGKYLTTNGADASWATISQPTLVSQLSNDVGYQTGAQVSAAVAGLVDSAPGTLDTLNELAAALGDDPNFATTVTTQLGLKANASSLSNVENKSSATIRSEITSNNVTSALGFTPYNATNPNGYLTSTTVTPTQVSDKDNASTGYFDVPAGTTAERPASPNVGMIRYNTTLGFLEQYNNTGWQGIDAPPVVTNFSGIINTDTDSVITINGSNFKAGCAVYIEGNGVNNVSRSLTTTYVSSSQITAQTSAASTNYTGGASFNIKVVNPSGLSSTLSPAGNIDRDPVWSTSAGTLATINDRHGNYSPISTLSASDPDGTSITYSVTSGSIPTNSSLNTSSGQITGSPGDVSGTTTYSFAVTASSNNQSAPRSFSIIVNKALDGSSSDRAASNATNIKTLTGTTTNGVYWLNLPIVGVTQVYCDMATDGGGWMMFAYAGSTSGVGDSNHMIYNTIGSLVATRSYEQTAFSRFDIARAMSGASSSSLLMWRRTNDSNKILIHSANEMWNRMPGGGSAGNRDMNGSGSGYPISTMKMSRTGPNGIVTKTNGRYESGPGYPGIAWNSSYNDNSDNTGSFDTYLNRRQIAYWETNGPQSQGQWFHGSVLSLGDGSGPTGSQNRKDVEIYFKV